MNRKNYIKKIYIGLTSFYSKYPTVSLIGINTLVIFLSITVLPFRYETMDDRYYLSWVTSGYLSGTPDYHTLFMNALYSWFESRLYIIAPNIEWHTWLLLIIHFFSLSSIGICLINGNHSKTTKIASLIILYLLEIYLLTNLQFTTTAGLAATAGILLIIVGEKQLYWLGCSLFIVGSMIRYPSAMFCGIVAAAFYPMTVLRLGFYRERLIALCLCAIGAISLHIIDKQIYLQDPIWKGRYEFNKLRGAVFDNSNTWRLVINPPDGISRNDFDVMGTVYDTVNWNEDAYNRCLNEIELQTTYHGIPGLKKVKNIPNELSQFWLWFLSLLPIMVYCMLNCAKLRERAMFILGFLSLPLAMAFIALNTRLVLHAFLCGWLPVLFISICIVPDKRKWTSIWLYISLSLIIPSIIPNLHLGQITSANLYRQQMELVKIGEQNGAKYFVIDYYSEKCEYPFGLRYHFSENDIHVNHINNSSLKMVDNESYVFILKNESNDSQIEAITENIRHQNNDSIGITSQKIMQNESYVLSRLITTK